VCSTDDELLRCCCLQVWDVPHCVVSTHTSGWTYACHSVLLCSLLMWLSFHCTAWKKCLWIGVHSTMQRLGFFCLLQQLQYQAH
jgi:hypothetical protein